CLEIEGLSSGEVSPLFWLNIITPDYFRVMGIAMLAGRPFTDSDIASAPVAILTAETARRFWPNQSAVGKHVRLLDEKEWRTVVGVIQDVRAYDLQRNVPNWMVGIYGVLSFLVSKRTREIGIRLALGAQRRDVLLLIMKEGAKFSFVGIALGVAGAFAVTRLLASELYGVSATDPITYAGVAMVMILVTLLACYLPTRRAMRVDPITALRYE